MTPIETARRQTENRLTEADVKAVDDAATALLAHPHIAERLTDELDALEATLRHTAGFRLSLADLRYVEIEALLTLVIRPHLAGDVVPAS